jgi:6-phosphogluconolactonase
MQHIRHSPPHEEAKLAATDLIVASTIRDAVRWVAEQLNTQSAESLDATGTFTLCLAGGGTPRSLYELLASPLWRARLDWSRFEIYLGDERYVPPTDPRSNFRMIREALIDRVLVPQRNVHPIPTLGRNIDADADRYAATLRKTLPDDDGAPVFDFLLLGLGPDGHTASLFPGSWALDETERPCVGVRPPAAPTPRITLTLPVLNAARHVVVLTAGHLKAGALAEMLAAPGAASDVPARRLSPKSGRLVVVCDLEACERLDAVPLREGIVTIRI